MNNKGFAEIKTNIETPNGNSFTEKPLKTHQIRPNRVDINVLKSKLHKLRAENLKRMFTYYQL